MKTKSTRRRQRKGNRHRHSDHRHSKAGSRSSFLNKSTSTQRQSSSFTPFIVIARLGLAAPSVFPFTPVRYTKTPIAARQRRRGEAASEASFEDNAMTPGASFGESATAPTSGQWVGRRSRTHAGARTQKIPTAEVLADRQKRPTVKGSRGRPPTSRGQHNSEASEVAHRQVAPERRSTPRPSSKTRKGLARFSGA